MRELYKLLCCYQSFSNIMDKQDRTQHKSNACEETKLPRGKQEILHQVKNRKGRKPARTVRGSRGGRNEMMYRVSLRPARLHHDQNKANGMDEGEEDGSGDEYASKMPPSSLQRRQVAVPARPAIVTQLRVLVVPFMAFVLFEPLVGADSCTGTSVALVAANVVGCLIRCEPVRRIDVLHSTRCGGPATTRLQNQQPST